MSKIDVSKCKNYYKHTKICLTRADYMGRYIKCSEVPVTDCYYKQLQQLKAENEKLKYFLNKIREEELNSLDIEWDEYETECRTTDYSNIVTLVEKALGEQDE